MNHTGTIGEMDFGMGASGGSVDLSGDLTSIQLRWFDQWLKGVQNGVDQAPPVHLFAMGEKRW